MLEDLCTAFFTASKSKRLEGVVPVIAFEGQSYAGKSTALAALQQGGYGTIREYSEYQTEPSPDHFVPQSPDEAKKDFLFYLGIEHLRYLEYLEKTREHRAILLDRSLFTLLAYRCAILPLSAPVDVEHLSWVVETLLSGAFPLLWPDHVIYLQTPLSVLRHRHQRAGDHLPTYFMDEQFYTAFLSFFRALQRADPTRITFIDSTQDPAATLQRLHALLEQCVATGRRSCNGI